MEVGLDIFEGIGVVPTFKVALQHLRSIAVLLKS
jgi:hypothetical protein